MQGDGDRQPAPPLSELRPVVFGPGRVQHRLLRAGCPRGKQKDLQAGGCPQDRTEKEEQLPHSGGIQPCLQPAQSSQAQRHTVGGAVEPQGCPGAAAEGKGAGREPGSGGAAADVETDVKTGREAPHITDTPRSV